MTHFPLPRTLPAIHGAVQGRITLKRAAANPAYLPFTVAALRLAMIGVNALRRWAQVRTAEVGCGWILLASSC